MEDTVELIGVVMSGAALAVPLLYGVSTLLGMTHKRFHPIFRRQQQDGASVPVMNEPIESQIERHEPDHKAQRRRRWSRPGI